MSEECLFCKIVAGEIPSDRVWEDDDVVAFRDISPQAPVHVLVIPKRHLASLDETAEGDAQLLGRLLGSCRSIAEQEGIAGAYRVVNNCGAAAGQSVFHIHLHVLGGRSLGWPPG
ncbi:MAG: histidine triad nucleotide-binding protein [bacterium]|nr:histidine triad nucleotide-binding protein [bacterium]